MGVVWGVLLVLVIFLVSSFSVFASNPAVDALRASVKITHDGVVGVGFFVGCGQDNSEENRLLLVSAAHVFDDMGDECTLVYRIREGETKYTRKNATVAIRDNEKDLWERHPDLDIGVLEMDTGEVPDDVDMAPLRYDQIACGGAAEDMGIQVGDEVFVPTFPAGLEGHSAGWPVLRVGRIATHPLMPYADADDMLVNYAAFGGDSGGPVVMPFDGETVVVGMAIAAQRRTDKVSTPFEERTTHIPLGLSVVVRSPFIRKVIDTLNESE